MYLRESTITRLQSVRTHLTRWGWRAWAVLIAVAATIGITLIIATGFLRPEVALATVNGDRLTNGEELLAEAEAAHVQSLPGEVDTLTAHGEEGTQCFYVMQGETLTDYLACGVVRYPSHEVGGYDITRLVFTQTESGVTGALSTGEWERQGSIPAGASLVRPDGLQALAGDALRRPIIEAAPLPEPETVVVERVVESEPQIITEYIETPVLVRVPTRETVEVVRTRVIETVTTEEGEYRAPLGQELVEVETAPAPAEVTAYIETADGNRESIDLGTISTLSVTQGEPVVLVLVWGETEQRVTLTGEHAGEREGGDVLYVPENLLSATTDTTRLHARDSERGEVEATVDVQVSPYREDIGSAAVEVTLSSVSNMCRGTDDGGWRYAASTAAEPYAWGGTLTIDGVEAGSPTVVAETGVYTLIWAVEDVPTTATWSPGVTLSCEGVYFGGEPFEAYTWEVPGALLDPITATWSEPELDNSVSPHTPSEHEHGGEEPTA